MKKIVALVAVAGLAGIASAQDYPVEATMTFEAFNGTSWVRNIDAIPGAKVEYRVRINYTGPRTDLFAIGEVQYQPILSNADNTGAGNDADSYGPLRNGGVSGNSIANSLLSTAEGNTGTELTSYGRVKFGATANNTTSNNVLTQFRHSAGSNGAPTGEWLRQAGTFVSQWPAFPLTTAPGADAINRIQRGVTSQQVSLALSNPADLHQAGVSNITVFRQQVDLADSNGDGRVLTLTSMIDFLKRAGGPTSTDDRRYMSFQTSNTDNGSHRVGVVFEGLTINVIPTPATAALLGLGGLVAARRRRA